MLPPPPPHLTKKILKSIVSATMQLQRCFGKLQCTVKMSQEFHDIYTNIKKTRIVRYLNLLKYALIAISNWETDALQVSSIVHVLQQHC